jgi:phosphatidylinositol kinase/protein kinase (PI-3  family)
MEAGEESSSMRQRDFADYPSLSLDIRTYAVTPLNEECGLIEWVDNLRTFRDIVLHLYKSKGITPNVGFQ